MKNITLRFEDTLEQTGFYFSEPIAEICAHQLCEVLPCLDLIDHYRNAGYYLAGYLSYEAGWALFSHSQSQKKLNQVPYLHFAVFKEKKAIANFTTHEKQNCVQPFLYQFQSSEKRTAYVEALSQIHQFLFDGEAYQVNYTWRDSFKTNISSDQLYDDLKTKQRTHYSAFFDFFDYKILSFSPELFIRKKNSLISSEPMKGTLPAKHDKAQLLNDEKIKAENLMIVDLIRNDLGKIAQPGSVNVRELFAIQTLETVHQMTSLVDAIVDPQLSFKETLLALFPCGSITGAPKLSAMKMIDQFESSPRGVYTGIMGYIEPNNDFCFNVAIRTLFEKQGVYSYGVGGGVLIDSNTDSEFQEAQLKALFLKKMNSHFHLFETLHFNGHELRHLDRHMQRLEESAGEFGFLFDREKILQDISNFMEREKSPGRVRFQLEYDGAFSIHRSSLLRPIGSRVIISKQKINSVDIFRKHKTSERKIYDEEYQKCYEMGFYDCLFFNEKDELAEASRHNIFLKDGDKWFTPPLSTGVLPGIERARTLVELNAQEKVLRLADLKNAKEILLTNSLRGRVSVQLEST